MSKLLCRARMFVFLALAQSLVFSIIHSAYADNAVSLPQGYGFLNLENRYFLPTDQRYDRDGNSVAIGSDFSRNLTSAVFPALSGLDPFVGGTASIGSSEVDIKRHFNIFRPLLAYGVTDRLTVGVIIPYIWAKNEVKANVSPATANVVKNSFCFGNPACGPVLSAIPLAPIGTPGGQTITTEDVQNLLGGGLDVNGDGVVDQPGQGLKRVETRQSNGLGDIEFGGRYQYYRSESFRAAFTGIVIAPTGKMDDPDDLVDIPLGDGNWAIRFQFQQDILKQQEGPSKRLGFPEVGSYYINTTFEYLYNLPDKRVVRVCDPHLPVCTQKAEVTRKAGDIIQAEIQGNLGVLTNGLFLMGGYNYQQQLRGHFTGDTPGLPYGDLAIDTDTRAHEFMVGVTYSTVPLVVKKIFPFPVVANVQYRQRFAGENVFKNESLWFTISSYFDLDALMGMNSR